MTLISTTLKEAGLDESFRRALRAARVPTAQPISLNFLIVQRMEEARAVATSGGVPGEGALVR